MAFVQIIEFSSQRSEELRTLSEELRDQNDGSTARRGVICQDRDKPGRYFNIVEFDSYESAMENSARPETSEFASRMQELCDGPPTFHNLDVVESWTA